MSRVVVIGATGHIGSFERAMTRPAAIGDSFHVVSEQAMTLRGLAEF
jgi:hypothetical protein